MLDPKETHPSMNKSPTQVNSHILITGESEVDVS